MIIKMQSVLFPYARHREEKKRVVLTKKDRVNADRVVMIFLFAITIVAAVIFSLN
jgi:hypothetical protein